MRNSIRQSIWQAAMELMGRPFHNMMIAVIMIILVICCGFVSFLSSAVESFYRSFANFFGYSIIVELNDYARLEEWSSIIDSVMSIEHITAYNNGITELLLCTPVNFRNVPYEKFGTAGEEDGVYLCGNINTEYNDYFRNGAFDLKEGCFPEQESNGAVIEESLALENRLSVGDVLEIEWNGEKTELSVTGIYEVRQAPRTEIYDGYYQIAANSIVFCDYLFYEEVTEIFDCRILFFFVDSYANMESSYEAVSELMASIDHSFVMDAMATQETQISEVITMLKQMAGFSTAIECVVGVVVMSLLIVLWLKTHSKMVVIYQILGQPPVYVIRNLMIEILMVTVPTAVFSTILTLMFLNCYSDKFFLNLLEFGEISNDQRDFSTGIWDFSMDYIVMLQGVAVLELVTVAIVLIGSTIMLCRPVRKMK